MLHFINVAIVILAVSGVTAWALRFKQNFSAMMGGVGCVVAGVIGLCGAGMTLFSQRIENSRQMLNAPYASLSLGLDSLSALFLLPLFLVGTLAAATALRRGPGDFAANRPHEHWLFYNFTLAGAALAVIARNAVLFMFAWEIMTVASFLLVENEQRERGGHGGGWIYLSAGHIGAAALFAMFALLGSQGLGQMRLGTLDFSSLGATGGVLSAAFVLAFVGFGGKVGLAPFQTWYPEAYPLAPAHVGAVLSGVVGNMGSYGLLRCLMLTGGAGASPFWSGYLLLGGGLVAALLGAARALAARDLSRLLAWSSVENYGLMGAGIGLGLLGASMGDGIVSFLGFAGTIFHMLNHSVAKALLFLSAGTVYARTGTRSLDGMGGLAKRIPCTGILFLVGALGAAAVLPLNAFGSEFLLLMAAFSGAACYARASGAAAVMFGMVAVVAVVGGLAVAAYIKAFGFVFLGNPRGPGAASAAPERRRFLLPHAVLAAVAAGLALASPWVFHYLRPTVTTLVRLWRQGPEGGVDVEVWMAGLGEHALEPVFIGVWLMLGCLLLAYLLRQLALRGKRQSVGATWDCGYAAPTNRMQYTATSFTRPLVDNFNVLVGIEDEANPPKGIFPGAASFKSWRPGVEKAFGFSQLFRWVLRAGVRTHVMQEGRVHWYLLYMAVVLVLLLAWKL